MEKELENKRLTKSVRFVVDVEIYNKTKKIIKSKNRFIGPEINKILKAYNDFNGGND